MGNACKGLSWGFRAVGAQAPAPHVRGKKRKRPSRFSLNGLYLCRQRPDFILSEAEGLPHTFACSTIGPAGLNLRRFAGVSEAGARSRNPEGSLQTSLFGMGTPRPRLRWKLDLRIAAGYRCLDGFDDAPNIWPKAWPLLQTENHDRYFPACEILLIRHVLVGGQQNVEAVGFCGREQFAILSVSQPCCAAVRTSCPSRKARMGTGVAWSNRTRILCATP
jgi:hypothetical protein